MYQIPSLHCSEQPTGGALTWLTRNRVQPVHEDAIPNQHAAIDMSLQVLLLACLPLYLKLSSMLTP